MGNTYDASLVDELIQESSKEDWTEDDQRALDAIPMGERHQYGLTRRQVLDNFRNGVKFKICNKNIDSEAESFGASTGNVQTATMSSF